MVGAPLLSDAQTGPGGLGIADGRWACQVAARAPPLRTLTPQVAARARRPHRHLKGPPANGRATTPPSIQPPCHTATQAPTVGSIIPAARTEARRTRHAAPQKTPRHEPPRPNRGPLHPKHPMSPAFHRGGLHFEQPRGGFCDHRPLHGHAALALPSNHTGGFATIDHRHAGDTPQGSAYGSNSPQATNEDDPHHTNTRDIPPATSPPSTQPPRPNRSPLHPKHPISPAYHRGGLHFEQPRGGFCDHRPLHGHAALALPSNHTGGFATIDHRHAGDTPQGSAYGSNSPQATNEDNPHHQDKWTRMSNTTHTTPETYHQPPHHQPPQQTQATTRGCNRATTQPRAGGTPRGYSKRGRHQPTPCASALTHP